MATHAPRSKAHETLTADELAALTACAERAGGWRALAREWEALGATTLQRLARGESATPTVLFTARVQLVAATAPTTPPTPKRRLYSVPAAPPGVARALPPSTAAPAARKARGG